MIFHLWGKGRLIGNVVRLGFQNLYLIQLSALGLGDISESLVGGIRDEEACLEVASGAAVGGSGVGSYGGVAP